LKSLLKKYKKKSSLFEELNKYQRELDEKKRLFEEETIINSKKQKSLFEQVQNEKLKMMKEIEEQKKSNTPRKNEYHERNG